MRGDFWLAMSVAATVAVGCAGGGSALPPPGAASTVDDERVFCAASLRAPEQYEVSLAANSVHGVDCVPPAGGERFSFGFAHRDWWLQLDVARSSLVAGVPHPLDEQASLLALDCWEWDGSLIVDADDESGWALRLDARCRSDATVAVDGHFEGER